MLNINQITGMTTKDFLTPAEKLVKTDQYKNDIRPEDYFKTPDLSQVSVQTSQESVVPEFDEYEDGIPEIVPYVSPVTGMTQKYSLENAKEQVRDLVEVLKNNGIKVNIDEMDFEKSYQIIIKMEKE